MVSITAFLKSKANPRLTPQYSTLTYHEKQRISEDGRKEANMKKASSWRKRKQHHTIKNLSYTPLADGWYRCNQTNQRLRQSQILNYILGGSSGTTVIKRGPPPKKTVGQRHPSKWRQKQR